MIDLTLKSRILLIPFLNILYIVTPCFSKPCDENHLRILKTRHNSEVIEFGDKNSREPEQGIILLVTQRIYRK